MKDIELLTLLKNDPERGITKAVEMYSAYVLKIAYTKLGDDMMMTTMMTIEAV